MRKVNYKEKGITLIALVITIIILLILAGVTLGTALGQNGLFQRAKIAGENYKRAESEESQSLKDFEEQIKEVSNEEERNAKYENNGIDKSHDGAQYDAVTTDDGIWTIYKDIDTRTTKVNVYVESKYYYPSFEQFILEKMFLVEFLYGSALPIYSFSDLSDFYAMCLLGKFDILGLIADDGVLHEDDYMKNRRKEMEIGPFLDELLKQTGTNEYDVLEELGKEVKKQVINGYGRKYMPTLTLENLSALYNKLYGDKNKLTISEEEKNKTYTIELPDGKREEIRGEDLYKARFRYATTKNGDIKIKISDGGSNTKEINYTKVNNIDRKNCIIEDGEYVYTYNCIPYIDDGLEFVMIYLGSVLDEEDEENIENMEAWLEIVDDMITNFRFNLGGWNVTRNGLTGGFVVPDDISSGELGDLNGQCKNAMNDEPVTCMVGTYLGSKLNTEEIMIPSTVKYMFDTFRKTDFSEDFMGITIPSSTEFIAYLGSCFWDYKNISGGENIKNKNMTEMD